MKRAFLAVAALLVLLVAAPVAAAQPGHGHKAGPAKAKAFTVKGAVTAIDAEAGSITLKVWNGSRGLRKLRGQELTVQVGADTRIARFSADGPVAVQLADVVEGERIRAWGRIDRSDPTAAAVYRAKRVALRAAWPFSLRGTVAAVDATAGTLSVSVLGGGAAVRCFIGEEPLLINVAPEALIVRCVDDVCTPIALSDIVEGDLVCIGGRVNLLDPDGKTYTAFRIMVRGAAPVAPPVPVEPPAPIEPDSSEPLGPLAPIL